MVNTYFTDNKPLKNRERFSPTSLLGKVGVMPPLLPGELVTGNNYQCTVKRKTVLQILVKTLDLPNRQNDKSKVSNWSLSQICLLLESGKSELFVAVSIQCHGRLSISSSTKQMSACG